MASSVSQERLVERKPQVPVGRLVSQSVSSGRNISKEVKAMPHDISSPFSENSTVSRRALGIL